MLRCHQYKLKSLSGPLAAVLGAAVIAGCSADIRRLEQPTYALGEKPPLPAEPVGRRSAAPITSDEPAAPRPVPGDRVVALGDTSAPVNPSVPFDAPRKPKHAAAPAQPAPAAPASAPIVAGNTVEVQQGDTLYGLSKRHHVSIAALMELNQLKTAQLRPGQKIVLPANARRPIAKAAPTPVTAAVGQPPVAPSGPAPLTLPPKMASATPAPAAAPAHAAPAPAATDWDGTYVVKSGDSLYGVARAHKVNVAELQRVNGIADALKMRPGMTLKVPSGTSAATPGAAPAPVAAVDTTPRASALPAHATAAPPSGTGGVRLLNPPPEAQASAHSAGKDASGKDAAPTPPPAKVAGIGPVAMPAAAPGKFRWPAKGTVLAGFGKRPDGAHNDGINISVPAGTDISAAEAGTVAYAGSEIKAYGNLILLRHEGGWVTAYAHADQILVKRGDAVTRGQVIAKAGATGSVDQPQVHFELRQGSKPVDPAPHLEK